MYVSTEALGVLSEIGISYQFLTALNYLSNYETILVKPS